MEPKDERTLAQLAKEAIDVQSACNLSGLVFGWARAMKRLCELFPHLGTDARNAHPINVLWADKCISLAGLHNYGVAMTECRALAEGASS